MTDALVYAAGFGTRMGELTANTPKPMLDLGGMPIIARVCKTLSDGGVTQFHINTHYLGAQIQDYFRGKKKVQIHDEADGPYETGGTLKSLAHILPETVITANSDTLFLDHNPLELLHNNWSNNWDALLVLIPIENTIHHFGAGDFFLENGKPKWRGENARAPYVYSGLQMIRPEIAKQFSEQKFSLRLIWDELLKQGRLGAVVYDGSWIDIGTKEALLRARELWMQK